MAEQTYINEVGLAYAFGLLKAYIEKNGGPKIVNATSTDGVTYTATCEDIETLERGTLIVFIPDKTSTSATPTLNINGLGAVGIRRKLSSGTATLVPGLSTSFLYNNRPCLMMYDTATATPYWIVEEFSKPNANDIYGSVPVANGGTGVNTLTEGSYLVGNGTEDVQLKTPAEVLSDIGAVAKAGDTMTGALYAGASVQTPGTYMVRNSKLSTAEETPTVNGQIHWLCS